MAENEVISFWLVEVDGEPIGTKTVQEAAAILLHKNRKPHQHGIMTKMVLNDSYPEGIGICEHIHIHPDKMTKPPKLENLFYYKENEGSAKTWRDMDTYLWYNTAELLTTFSIKELREKQG